MGLFGFIKKAVDVVTAPIAGAGAFLGNVGGIAVDGLGQMGFGLAEDLVHIGTFGLVGHWHNPFHFDKKQLFIAGALGSKLGEFGAGFSAKLILGGGPIAIAASLATGTLFATNSVVNKYEVNPLLRAEGKLLGMGQADANAKVQLPALCGPTGKGPDGKEYQAIAIPLPPGAKTDLPTQTDPQTGQKVALALVSPGACKVDPNTPQGQQGIGVATTSPAELEKTKGLAASLAQASGH